MAISASLRQRVVERDQYRCVYCQTARDNSGQKFHIDHIVPISKGGVTTLDNLCTACFSCNSHKQARLTHIDPLTGAVESLFHPLQQHWADHFAWDESRTILIGLTPCGRATVAALQMNNDIVVRARHRWVIGGWHPPT